MARATAWDKDRFIGHPSVQDSAKNISLRAGSLPRLRNYYPEYKQIFKNESGNFNFPSFLLFRLNLLSG